MDQSQGQNPLNNNNPNNHNLSAMFAAGFPMNFMMQGDPRMAAAGAGNE